MMKCSHAYLQGWCVLPVCSRVQREASMANHGRELSTGWLSWQCPGLPRGPELPEVESQGRWRMTRDSWRSEGFFTLWADTMDGSQQWETPIDVQCFCLSHLFNHQAPIGLIQVCVCLRFDVCTYEVFTASALFSFSSQLLTFFFKCPCFHIIVPQDTGSTVFPSLWTFCFQLVQPVSSVTAPPFPSSCQWFSNRSLACQALPHKSSGKGIPPLLTTV